MKNLLFTFFLFTLTLHVQAQSVDEILRYSLELSCECGSEKFTELVPQETQDFINKLGTMEGTAINGYLASINPEERKKHLNNLQIANAGIQRDCNEASVEEQIIQKYPDARAILQESAATAGNSVLKLIDTVESCRFLKNTMIAIMSISMLEMEVAPASEQNKD